MILVRARKKLSICLVDDDRLARRDLGNVLDNMDIYIPIVCSDYYELIDEYLCYTQKGPPNFIISEWYKDFSDPDFLIIFSDSPLATIPIIILTDANRIKSVKPQHDIDIIGTLTKPVNRKDLKEMLTNYIRHKNAEEND
ncbi:response regulator [Chitinophaga ginsengisoli]|uniref:CheY-like chemotaxis protein n=1 Tax=Chitinophaga ginsengisoli TaxID=363837 RepID=A0A2P8G2W6_9BACT|nr:response regulator [Chitinophaga ginsengisoli]PSL28338.1 CheY-like chemotaxis protein [Chitinophaga ginsengisoli]